MLNRRVVGAAVLTLFVTLVIVAVLASDGQNEPSRFVNVHGRTAVVVRRGESVSRVQAAPLPIPDGARAAPAPCTVSAGSDPSLVFCGATVIDSGELATFHLVARGHVRDDCTSPTVEWGDGEGNVTCMIGCDAYPAEERTVDRQLEHRYAAPGAYTLRVTLQGCGPDARPQTEITMEVQVH